MPDQPTPISRAGRRSVAELDQLVTRMHQSGVEGSDMDHAIAGVAGVHSALSPYADDQLVSVGALRQMLADIHIAQHELQVALYDAERHRNDDHLARQADRTRTHLADLISKRDDQ